MAAFKLKVLQNCCSFSNRFSLSFLRTARYQAAFRRWSHKECSVEVEVGGRQLKFSTGKLALLADGSTVTQYEDTSVLVTAISSKKPSENSFLPLVVDYKEKASAACLIPTTFLRRDLLANEREILVCRRIDRSVRSLFMKGYTYDTQIISHLLAADRFNNPDVVAVNGASASLALSSIPWRGPVGAVRIGDVDGQLVVNPLRQQLEHSQLDLVVTSSESKIVMVEGFAKEVPDERLCEAIKLAFSEAQPIIQAIKELRSYAGKEKKHFDIISPSQQLSDAVEEFAAPKLAGIFSNFTYSKLQRDDRIFGLRDECVEIFQDQFPDSGPGLIEQAFNAVNKSVFRANILEKLQRCDGRQFDELRSIDCDINLYKTLHGSSLFKRGETQVFSTATFGSVGSAAKVDTISEAVGGSKEKQFMLHYEFPPFSTNEVKQRRGSFDRREIGHGALAERALVPVLPDELPFTLRLTAEVLGSNGSSSLASACAGSLAMMDAGVPIKSHVAGSACGLVTSSDAEDASKRDIDNYQLLTDILGIEDYLGDMDFKIAGTRQGITALQADFKVPGLPVAIVEEAIRRCSVDRAKVLDVMEEVIPIAREFKKDNIPVSGSVRVPLSKRGRLIGTGGMVIRALQQELGVSIDQVEEEEFLVFAPDQTTYDEAISKINELLVDTNIFEELTSRLTEGAIYEGKIVEMRAYGLMLELFADCPTVLLHVRELDHARVHRPEMLGFKVGDSVSVKYLGIDNKGRLNISRKALLPPPPPRPFSGSRGSYKASGGSRYSNHGGNASRDSYKDGNASPRRYTRDESTEDGYYPDDRKSNYRWNGNDMSRNDYSRHESRNAFPRRDSRDGPRGYAQERRDGFRNSRYSRGRDQSSKTRDMDTFAMDHKDADDAIDFLTNEDIER